MEIKFIQYIKYFISSIKKKCFFFFTCAEIKHKKTKKNFINRGVHKKSFILSKLLFLLILFLLLFKLNIVMLIIRFHIMCIKQRSIMNSFKKSGNLIEIQELVLLNNLRISDIIPCIFIPKKQIP